MLEEELLDFISYRSCYLFVGRDCPLDEALRVVIEARCAAAAEAAEDGGGCGSDCGNRGPSTGVPLVPVPLTTSSGSGALLPPTLAAVLAALPCCSSSNAVGRGEGCSSDLRCEATPPPPERCADAAPPPTTPAVAADR